MKLYEIPHDSKIKLCIEHGSSGAWEEICDFKHIDGMYSLIITEGGNTVHLGASTEVKLVNGVYELLSTPKQLGNEEHSKLYDRQNQSKDRNVQRLAFE